MSYGEPGVGDVFMRQQAINQKIFAGNEGDRKPLSDRLGAFADVMLVLGNQAEISPNDKMNVARVAEKRRNDLGRLITYFYENRHNLLRGSSLDQTYEVMVFAGQGFTKDDGLDERLEDMSRGLFSFCDGRMHALKER